MAKITITPQGAASFVAWEDGEPLVEIEWQQRANPLIWSKRMLPVTREGGVFRAGWETIEQALVTLMATNTDYPRASFDCEPSMAHLWDRPSGLY